MNQRELLASVLFACLLHTEASWYNGWTELETEEAILPRESAEVPNLFFPSLQRYTGRERLDDVLGGGWTLVRRVKAGDTWHPADDALRGTWAPYGEYGTSTSDSTFNIKWHSWPVDQLMAATGDMEHWAVFWRDDIESATDFNSTANANPRRLRLVASSNPDAPPDVELFWRNGGSWLSNRDHYHGGATGTTDSEAHSMLYGEGEDRSWTYWLQQHNGANVWVRSSSEQNTSSEPSRCCSADLELTEEGTWNEVRDQCHDMGKELVHVYDQETQDAVDALCPHICYIGLYRYGEGPLWAWTDGTILNYTAWDQGQPGPGETMVVHMKDRGWHDWQDGEVPFRGVCGAESETVHETVLETLNLFVPSSDACDDIGEGSVHVRYHNFETYYHRSLHLQSVHLNTALPSNKYGYVVFTADNQVTGYLNGDSIGTVSDWTSHATASDLVFPTGSVIAMAAVNHGTYSTANPAGIAVHAALSDESCVVTTSSSQWMCTESAPGAGWNDVDFVMDDAWTPAIHVSPLPSTFDQAALYDSDAYWIWHSNLEATEVWCRVEVDEGCGRHSVIASVFNSAFPTGTVVVPTQGSSVYDLSLAVAKGETSRILVTLAVKDCVEESFTVTFNHGQLKKDNVGNDDLAVFSGWHMHDGLDPESPFYDVVAPCNLERHGDECVYVAADVPPRHDAAWEPAWDLDTVNMEEISKLCESGSACWDLIDFRYFQTYLQVWDADTKVEMLFRDVDDGAVVQIYNPDYPAGLMLEQTYVYYPSGTQRFDISQWLVTGETNRIVVTQFDCCCSGNFAREISFRINESDAILHHSPTLWIPTFACESVSGDGNCDIECNTFHFGFDGGDCSQCEPSCESLLKSGDCPDECLTESCSFGMGMCSSTCPCDHSLLGNGLCDSDCNSPECFYDHTDCCPHECDGLSTNGECDIACNSLSCNFDGGDCLCQCDTVGDGVCDELCMSSSCWFDGGDCSISFIPSNSTDEVQSISSQIMFSHVTKSVQSIAKLDAESLQESLVAGDQVEYPEISPPDSGSDTLYYTVVVENNDAGSTVPPAVLAAIALCGLSMILILVGLIHALRVKRRNRRENPGAGHSPIMGTPEPQPVPFYPLTSGSVPPAPSLDISPQAETTVPPAPSLNISPQEETTVPPAPLPTPSLNISRQTEIANPDRFGDPLTSDDAWALFGTSHTYVTLDMFMTGFSRLPKPVNPSALKKLFFEIDSKSNGVIERDEFSRWWSSERPSFGEVSGLAHVASVYEEMGDGVVLECVVCMSQPRTIIFSPCHHVSVCRNCSSRLSKCPMCNALIESRDRVWM